MSFYTFLLKKLFDEYDFYVVNDSDGESIVLDYDDIANDRGLNPHMQCCVANILCTLGMLSQHSSEGLHSQGLANSLPEAMFVLGYRLVPDVEGTMQNVRTEEVPEFERSGHWYAENSLRLPVYEQALFSQAGNEYDFSYPEPGAKINITPLFHVGKELIDTYFSHLEHFKNATPERVQAIQRDAENGNSFARYVINHVLENTLENTPVYNKDPVEA